MKLFQYITILLFALASVWMGCKENQQDKYATALENSIGDARRHGWPDSTLFIMSNKGDSAKKYIFLQLDAVMKQQGYVLKLAETHNLKYSNLAMKYYDSGKYYHDKIIQFTK